MLLLAYNKHRHTHTHERWYCVNGVRSFQCLRWNFTRINIDTFIYVYNVPNIHNGLNLAFYDFPCRKFSMSNANRLEICHNALLLNNTQPHRQFSFILSLSLICVAVWLYKYVHKNTQKPIYTYSSGGLLLYYGLP